MVIRFDEDLQVKVLEELADDELVPGSDNLLLKDIPKVTPSTSLEAAVCLREVAIAVRVVLLEIVQKPNAEQAEKSMCKLRAMENRKQGPNYEVENWKFCFGVLMHGRESRLYKSSAYMIVVHCTLQLLMISI